MNFHLLTMSRAVTVSIRSFAESFSVNALINKTSLVYRVGDVLLDKSIAMVMSSMFGMSQQLKVFNNIMGSIMILVMHMGAFGHRAVVLLPKPDVIRLAAAVFLAFSFRWLESLERIASKLPSLVVLGTPAARVNGFCAIGNGASVSSGAAWNGGDLGFQRIAGRAKSVEVKSAIIATVRRIIASWNRARFSHERETSIYRTNCQPSIVAQGMNTHSSCVEYRLSTALILHRGSN